MMSVRGARFASVFSLCLAAHAASGQETVPDSLIQARQRAALSSPLDALSPSAIPPLERFDWQPKELVAVVGEHRGRQGSPAFCVAFNRDGTQVASGGSNGVIRFWDKATMRQHLLLGAHGHGAVRRIVFFDDGKTMASCGDDATVRLWDLTEKVPRTFATLSEASTAFYALAVTHDGKLLAVGGADTAIRLWALAERGQKLLVSDFTHKGAISGLSFSPDGKTLASCSHDESIRLWTMAGERLKERAVLSGHKQAVYCLSYSPEGGTLASGGADGTLRLWSAATAKPRAILQGKGGGVHALAFGPKGTSTLATGNADSTIRLWTLGTQPKERAILESHAGSISGVAISSQTKAGRPTALASSSADWTVRLWDLTMVKPREKTVTHGHISHTYTVAFAPDGKSLASGSEDRTLRLWDMTGAAPKEKYVYKKEPMAIYTMAYTPDGKGLVYAGNETTARLYEPERRWIARRFTGQLAAITNLALSTDGQHLITCSQNNVQSYNVANGQGEQVYKGPIKTVYRVEYSPDGKYVIAVGGNYEIKNGQVMVVDGKVVYVDCTLRIWDAAEGKELAALKDHPFPLMSCSFSPDGKRIAYGGQESVLRLLDFADGKPGKATTIKCGGGYLYWVSYAPDGKTFVTAGLDGRIILWDASGKRVREWSFPETTYRAIYSADSRHLAIPFATGVVYVLRIAEASAKGS